MSVAYLFAIPLTLFPILTALAIIFLLFSVLSVAYITGEITIVMDKKKRIFLVKNNKHNKNKNDEKDKNS
jgi:hypothetical protein